MTGAHSRGHVRPSDISSGMMPPNGARPTGAFPPNGARPTGFRSSGPHLTGAPSPMPSGARLSGAPRPSGFVTSARA